MKLHGNSRCLRTIQPSECLTIQPRTHAASIVPFHRCSRKRASTRILLLWVTSCFRGLMLCDRAWYVGSDKCLMLCCNGFRVAEFLMLPSLPARSRRPRVLGAPPSLVQPLTRSKQPPAVNRRIRAGADPAPRQRSGAPGHQIARVCRTSRRWSRRSCLGMHREAAQRMAWNVCGVGDGRAGRRTRANGCSAGSGAVAATELLALIPEAMIVASTAAPDEGR
jgi:hypothetical protein